MSISSLLVLSSGDKLESPVTFPAGRARLLTKPAPTGSAGFVITMRMVVLAFFTANVDGVSGTTIKSDLRRTNSAARSGRRSSLCSANRYSIVIFFPSTHPNLRNSSRNASQRIALPEAVLGSRIDAGDFSCLLRLGRETINNISCDDSCQQREEKLPNHDFPSCYCLLPSARCFLHRITLSARTNTLGGIVRPICLAVFRLMMNSNLVGCSTGRSSGLVPFKILST